MNEIIEWNYSLNDVRESAIDMRSKSAINYHKKVFSNDKLFHEWIHGFRYDCLNLVEEIIGQKYHGLVLEAGAGSGIYSCHMAKKKNVDKVLAVEYSEECVKNLMTYVIKRFKLNKKQEDKIYPVIGSFDEIKLENNSVDFIIAMGSLHHSENREKTICELYRVLKVGGYLVACERATENTTTNKELNQKLDVEFSNDFKKKMGYKESETYTRRDNSEHDPLMAEWEYLFAKAGFKNSIYWFHRGPRLIRGIGMIFSIFWHTFGRLFFTLFGHAMMKRRLTQVSFLKIPYFPWFSKSKKADKVLILSQKLPYQEMP